MTDTLRSQVLSQLMLPVRPAVAADAATLTVSDEPAMNFGPMPFFGGYADDMLADLGFDMAEEAPAVRVKQA